MDLLLQRLTVYADYTPLAAAVAVRYYMLTYSELPVSCPWICWFRSAGASLFALQRDYGNPQLPPSPSYAPVHAGTPGGLMPQTVGAPGVTLQPQLQRA